jgi:hypothetical protein
MLDFAGVVCVCHVCDPWREPKGTAAVAVGEVLVYLCSGTSSRFFSYWHNCFGIQDFSNSVISTWSFRISVLSAIWLLTSRRTAVTVGPEGHHSAHPVGDRTGSCKSAMLYTLGIDEESGRFL